MFSRSTRKLLSTLFLATLLLTNNCLAQISSAKPAKQSLSIQLSQVREVGPNDCARKNLTQAYSSIGVDLSFLVMPSKRALIESNAGRTDGETARIFGLESRYPNLVPIPVAICHMKQGLYSLKNNPKLTTKDINELKLGIINGGVYVESIFSAPSTVNAINNQQLLNLLIKGRVDAISISEKTLEKLATEEQIKQLTRLPHHNASVPLFHYLHKKHQTLIPIVTQALQELEKSGFVADAIKNHQP